eukprot:1158075-Pelagomonas_calceolata.AAC.4
MHYAGSHDALAGLAGNQPTGQAALFDWADKTLGQGLSHVTKSVGTRARHQKREDTSVWWVHICLTYIEAGLKETMD